MCWKLTDASAMDHPGLVMGGELSFTGRSDQVGPLAAQFRRLRRRRLVILGGPGSGKTTLAVQLLRELLDTRQPGEPIPVLVSLAGWDPNYLPLYDWLVIRVSEDYRSRALGPVIAQALAEQGHLLPILDGLDELPRSRQLEVIAAINKSLTETDQLILTSRTTEYIAAITDAGNVLTAAAVITPEPLTGDQVADYLNHCLPPDPSPCWRELLRRLRMGTAAHLEAVVSAPLGLWLLRTVYITTQTDPTPLLDPEVSPDSTTVHASLLDQLIPAVLVARPASRHPGDIFRPRRTWNPHDVRIWLAYLALYLDDAGTRDLQWWHLARHTLAPRAIGLMVGLLFGLGAGLAVALGGALPFFLVVGVGVGLVARRSLINEPAYAGLELDDRAKTLVRQLGAGLMAGLAFVLALGLVIGLTTGLSNILGQRGTQQGGQWVTGFLPTAGFALVVGLVFALVASLAVGLAARRWLTDEPAYANLKLNGRAMTLARQLVFGLVFGLTVGATVGVAFIVAIALAATLALKLAYGLGGDVLPLIMLFFNGLTPGLTPGLTTGLTFGLTVGLAVGLITWVGIPNRTGGVSSPRSTYKATRILTILQITLGGLAFGLAVSLTVRSTVDLALALAIGLMIGLTSISSGAWLSHVLAMRRLAASGKLPFRLMDFLNDAYRLGLLRTIGSVYQFRHAEFQDHLSRTDETV